MFIVIISMVFGTTVLEISDVIESSSILITTREDIILAIITIEKLVIIEVSSIGVAFICVIKGVMDLFDLVLATIGEAF